MKYKINKISFLPSLLIFLIFPLSVFSASVHIENNLEKIPINEEFILKIYLDTKGQEVNVIEGSINVEEGLDILSIEKNNSIFSLWPDVPEILENKIFFVGGIPGGVFGKDLRVFDIKIIAKKYGKFSVSSDELNLYLNDGIGTRIKVDPFVYEINTTRDGNLNKNTILLLITIIFLCIFLVYKINKKYKNK